MSKIDEAKRQSDLDKDLAGLLAQTLDKSVDELDELSVQRLKNARQRALAQPGFTKPKWISLSIAASLAVLLAAPFMWHQYSVKHFTDSDLELISQELPLDEQEINDMDMLMAIGDADA